MKDIIKLLGERIQQLRKEHGFSQEKLAHRANIHRSHLGKIERGEISVTIESVAKVADAFEMTLEEVFKHLQPSFENKDNIMLTDLMNKINSLRTDNQKVTLDFLDVLIRWKS